MINERLYHTYKARGFTDEQICTIAKVPRSELKKFKPKKNEVPPELMKKAAELGIHPRTVQWRMDVKHWTAEMACTTPKEESTVTMEQLKEAKKKFGLHPSSIYRRLERGMDLEQALTTPSIRKKKRKPSVRMVDLKTKVKSYEVAIRKVLQTTDDDDIHEFLNRVLEGRGNDAPSYRIRLDD